MDQEIQQRMLLKQMVDINWDPQIPQQTKIFMVMNILVIIDHHNSYFILFCFVLFCFVQILILWQMPLFIDIIDIMDIMNYDN